MQIDKSNMEVYHKPALKRFEVQINGALGMVEYIAVRDRIIFTHTEVHPSLEGQGVASLLAKTALEYASENHLQVMPLCPYIASYMRRHPEYNNLLAPGFHV